MVSGLGWALIFGVENKEKYGCGVVVEEDWSMRGCDRKRGGLPLNFSLLLSVLVLSYCLWFLLPNKSNFRNHLRFTRSPDFPYPTFKSTDK